MVQIRQASDCESAQGEIMNANQIESKSLINGAEQMLTETTLRPHYYTHSKRALLRCAIAQLRIVEARHDAATKNEVAELKKITTAELSKRKAD